MGRLGLRPSLRAQAWPSAKALGTQTQSRVLPGTAALSLEDRLQGSLGGQACHEGNAVFRAAWVGMPFKG